MRVRTFQLVAAAGTALLLSWAAFGGAHAQSPAPALTGQIIATDQALPMEGVLVSAQQSQSPITITVVSDQNGRFSFPAAKLAPGHYAIAHQRDRLRARHPASRRRCPRQDRERRSQAAQGRGSGGPAHQHRMVHELSRHHRAETGAHRMHELPHARADRALQIQRRRVHAGAQAHDHLRQQHHPGAGAETRLRASSFRRSAPARWPSISRPSI